MMFMHDYPLAVYFPQTNGETELQFDSFSVFLRTSAPHQSSDKRNVVARSNVHFIEIENYGIIGPGEKEIPGSLVQIDTFRLQWPRQIEHQYIRRVIGKNSLDIFAA